MRFTTFLAALAVTAAIGVSPAAAQGTPPAAGGGMGGGVSGGRTAEQPAAERPARRGRSARTTREPTAGQMAARERQKKCGVEWREAKAGNRTGGLKWPQYYSRCNARLKGNSA